MTLLWTKQSRADLAAIHRHIAEDSPMNAARLIDRLTRRAERIAMLPRSGRQVPEYGSEDVREILERPYRIIYRILSDHIDVLSVMHYRRLLPEDMDKL